jgi:hypothetical protein
MSTAGPGLFFGGFFALFFFIWVVAFASYGMGIAALISIARQPDDAFGPWWDNTKQSWIVGVVISFLLPFGTLVSGIAWFTAGKGPRRQGQYLLGRPFWSGPPKPMPYPYGQPPGPFGPGGPQHPPPPPRA